MKPVHSIMLAAALLQALAQPAAADPRNLAPAVTLQNASGSAVELVRCLAANDLALASGHRGGPEPGYPENAIETFVRTLSMAPMVIEVDVRTSKDGILLLMHDETLDRTTTGRGKVNDLHWQEIAALNLRDNDGRVTPFRVPTLAEAIQAMRGRGILTLDVKEDQSLPGIVKAINDADAHGFTVVNAYRPSQAKIVHDLDPRITLSHPVHSLADLDLLDTVGVRTDRLLAWTGIETIEGRNPDLWAALDKREIPSIYATLFVADKKIAKSGDTTIFREITAAGVDVIASDLHMDVHKTVSADRDLPAIYARCDGEAAGAQ